MAVRTANGIAIGTGIPAWQPAPGNRVKVTGLSFSVSAASSIAFTNGAGGAVLYRSPVIPANDPYTIQDDNLFSGDVDTTIVLIGPAATTVTGTLWGNEEFAGVPS